MSTQLILDFSQWNNVSNEWCGYYRYPIAVKAAYEIIVEKHSIGTPIEDAIASLFLVGLWRTKDGENILEREKLGESLPIKELVKIAYKDNEENNK